MKKLLFISACIFVCFGFVGNNTSIKVKKGTLTINSKKFPFPWTVAELKNSLGEPTRTRDGYNKTHTYDDMGIVLFEPMSNKVPSGNISELQVYFSTPDPSEVTPKGLYSQVAQVDKLKVTADLTSAKMLSTLKKWVKTDSYMEHSYRMASSGMYIYFQFNDAETQLIKMSIGPDKKSK